MTTVDPVERLRNAEIHWRGNAPVMLLDENDPNGNPCPTQLDRRWLWRLENSLAVSAPMGGHLDELRKDLSQYLNETCVHHWTSDEDYDGHPLRQCLWCHDTEWIGVTNGK